MDLQADRNWIISEIAKVQDPELISAFKSLLKYRAKQNQPDWWDELPDSVQESIEKGIDQANNGETLPHEVVMNKFKKKYGL